MRNAKWWCGAKNNEAPRSINRAMPEDGILVTSHQSLLISNPQSLILGYSFLLSNFGVQGSGFGVSPWGVLPFDCG